MLVTLGLSGQVQQNGRSGYWSIVAFRSRQGFSLGGSQSAVRVRLGCGEAEELQLEPGRHLNGGTGADKSARRVTLM